MTAALGGQNVTPSPRPPAAPRQQTRGAAGGTAWAKFRIPFFRAKIKAVLNGRGMAQHAYNMQNNVRVLLKRWNTFTRIKPYITRGTRSGAAICQIVL